MQGTLKVSAGHHTVDMPVAWNVAEHHTPRGYMITCQPPNEDRARVSLYNLGRTLPEADAEVFQALLKSIAQQRIARLIYDSNWEKLGTATDVRMGQVQEQIKSLTRVLGPLVGDNQFANTDFSPEAHAPTFHIERVELKNLNGKPVLSVEGYSCMEDGSPARFFAGTYVAEEVADHGSTVHQIFLEAEDKMRFVANKASYRKIVDSVEW